MDVRVRGAGAVCSFPAPVFCGQAAVGLTEGVQAFEKIRILKEEFERKGNKGAIKNIDKALKMFDESGMDKISPTTAVNKAKEVINRY